MPGWGWVRCGVYSPRALRRAWASMASPCSLRLICRRVRGVGASWGPVAWSRCIALFRCSRSGWACLSMPARGCAGSLVAYGVEVDGVAACDLDGVGDGAFVGEADEVVEFS